MDMTPAEVAAWKLDLARRIVKVERGLKELPKANHSRVVELAALSQRELKRMANGEGKRAVEFTVAPPIATPDANRPVDLEWSRTAAPSDTPTLGADWDTIVARKVTRCPITKKQPHGRIIRRIRTPDGKVRELHATKGWRECRA